jgi:hypothetical protein
VLCRDELYEMLSRFFIEKRSKEDAPKALNGVGRVGGNEGAVLLAYAFVQAFRS